MHRFDGGGAERMTVILANELYKRGYEVTFCVREDAGETRVLLQKDIPVLDMKLMQAGKLYRNLKNISVKIPLGEFVCVTGVSGVGNLI